MRNLVTNIEQQPRDQRRPGKRSKRIEEAILLRTLEEQRLHPGMSEPEARRRAWDFVAGQTATNPVFEKALEATAPTSLSPDRTDVVDKVEIAAVLRNPICGWLRQLLLAQARPQGGVAGKRDLVVSVFLEMAFALGDPAITNTMNRFTEESNAALGWAYDYPKGTGLKATYYSLHRALAGKPVEMVCHANVELFRELATGHPNAAKHLMADATLVEADVLQKMPKSEAHLALLRGEKFPNASFVKYSAPGQAPWKKAFGYKLVVIADMATTLPLVFKLIPASGDERQATRELLRVLFALWPDCPAEYLVGDSLYDHSEDFATELVFDWGLHPVFPRHSTVAEGYDYHDSEGVPKCRHGHMKPAPEGFWGPEKRRQHGLARGERAPSLKARIRWHCAGPGSPCPGVTTYPKHNPRLYTYLPREGDSAKATLRTALLVRRNAIESIYSSLKHLGLGRNRQGRARWANEAELEWLLSTALFFLTARRLAHEDGSYERAHEEAGQLGVLTQPTPQCPNPGPSESELADVRDARQQTEPPPRPPATTGQVTITTALSRGEPLESMREAA